MPGRAAARPFSVSVRAKTQRATGPHAYPLSGGGMSEAGFPGFDGLSGLRSSDGSVAPNPVHPINPVNLASDKLPKWLTRTQFVIARSEVRRWRMAISFQERRSLPRRDCRAALAMTVWGRLPRCARNDSLGKVGTREATGHVAGGGGYCGVVFLLCWFGLLRVRGFGLSALRPESVFCELNS